MGRQKKVEKAGNTFIAIGGNTFQAGYTFHALFAANAGPDVYNRFYGHKIDKSVLDDPAVRSTISSSARLPSRPTPAG